LDDVLDALACRPVDQHVVVTGRSAPKALIDAADTVTEMQAVKHAFQAGVSAQKGIEL
jgi:cob(I)alamin adenosyltransferase